MKKNNRKNREGVVYSTNPEYQYQHTQEREQNTLANQNQTLKVSLDKSGRAGKQVTLISGFIGKPDDLEQLAKRLKTKCGTGGSVKDGEILIQGDVREKVVAILTQEGFKTKRGN